MCKRIISFHFDVLLLIVQTFPPPKTDHMTQMNKRHQFVQKRKEMINVEYKHE